MKDKIRTAVIGSGYRGMGLICLLKQIKDFTITGIADPSIKKGKTTGCEIYNHDETDYQRMIIEQHPELVIISSPWECHIEQASYALEHDANIAIEIKGGLYINEYQSIIDIASRKHLRIYPMENTVFLRENMAIINMARKGIFGDIIAMKGGYRHDLRKLLINEEGELGDTAKSESTWRSKFYQTENGDIYPTHGLAPLCLAANIGHTDTIKSLTSFASRAKGIESYIRSIKGESDVNISLGDIIITIMETRKGILLTLTHDTTLPRPKSLDYEIQGTKGIWNGNMRQIYLEGLSPDETWEDDAKYISQYESELWEKWGVEAIHTDTHHKGMDYIMLRSIAEDLNGNMNYPITPEDLSLWTSISPLSKLSIEKQKTIQL